MFAIGTCVSPSLKQNFHKENPCAITYVALAALTFCAVGAAMISQGGYPIAGGVLIGLGALEALVDLVFYSTTKKPPAPTTPRQKPLPAPPTPPKKPSPPPRRVFVMEESVMLVGGTDSDEGGSRVSRALGTLKNRFTLDKVST